MRSSLKIIKTETLRRELDALGEARAGMRQADLADHLGCPEAALLAVGSESMTAHRICISALPGLMAWLAGQSGWMWLVRYGAFVLEKDAGQLRWREEGEFWSLEGSGFDLKIQSEAIGSAFWVEGNFRLPRSLQLFNREGRAMLKIFLRHRPGVEPADAKFLPHREEPLETLSFEVPEREKPGRRSEATDISEVADFLKQAAADKKPIDVQLSHSAVTFRLRHCPRTVSWAGDWLNILDRGFNLHLLSTGVREISLEHPSGGLECREERGECLLRLAPAPLRERVEA